MAKRIKYEDRTSAPLMLPQEKVKTFREYAFGYSVSLALDEAQRCIKGCPKGAYRKIVEVDSFICGRICPQERQCEGSCISYCPVSIGAPEKFVGDIECIKVVNGGDTAVRAFAEGGKAVQSVHKFIIEEVKT